MQRARTDEAKDQRRQALLSAALDVFYEKGFAAARMDDIAARANLSKGAIYLYFDSKEDLFKALIASLTGPKLEDLEAIAGQAGSMEEALTLLAGFAPSIIRQSDLPKLMKVLVGDSHVFPDTVRAYREDVLERLLGIVAGALTRARDAGEIEIGDPALTARLVIAPIALSGMWQAVFGRDAEAEIDLEALFALHARTMIRGMRPEAAS